MRTVKVYLDTNIIIALLAEKRGDTELEKRRIESTQALNILNEFGSVVFYVSTWALTEMVKVMINEYNMSPKKVAVLHNSITTSLSIAGFEFKLIHTSPTRSYSIESLFLDIREIMTNYSPGWGDAIHCVIMRQNKIENILSRDGKKDFKIIPGLYLIHPSNIISGK